MSISEVVNNAGNLFNEESLTNIKDYIQIDDSDLRDHFDQIREHYERRRGGLAANAEQGPADPPTVGFYFVGRVLHILGYTHSHGEPLPNDRGRIDYTLFDDAEDFTQVEQARGSSQLFASGLAVLKLLPWGIDLDGADDESEEATPHPAFELDEILRQTGLQWAMLSNGRKWRLYHRNTVGMLNTYYEVDLGEIVETSNFGDFRYFTPFEKLALLPGAGGLAPARGLLT